MESEPAAGARLGSGPGEITLGFTEPLDRGLTEIRLVDAGSGETIPAQLRFEAEKEAVLQPQRRLGRAPYRVEWRTVSTVDGHTLEGTFSFGVRTPALPGEPGLEQSPLARDGWLRIAARAIFYAALFFFAGGLLANALLSPRVPGGWLVPLALSPQLWRVGVERQATMERAWRRTLTAGWLAVLAAVLVAAAEAADAAGGLGLEGMGDFLISNDAGLARAGVVVALTIAATLASRLPIAASAWLVLALLAIAFGGHANSADPRGLAVVTDWIHLVAGGLWVGGIAQIAATWLPLLGTGGRELGTAAAREVLPRFGRVALPAFLVVAATGVTNALIQLGGPSALWETPYGRVLAVKIGLVGLIATASFVHAFRLRPRVVGTNPDAVPRRDERWHWRLLGSEPWLGLGAIVAVAALVAFPLPPQQIGEAGEAEAEAPCEPCPLAPAKQGELAVAEDVGTRIAALWIRHDGEHLHGRLELLDRDTRPVDAPISLGGAELVDCGEGCWRFEAPPVDELAITAEEDGEKYTATVPASWNRQRTADARRLLGRTQATMRELRSLRVEETVSSGPGASVRTRYRYVAPDRMAYRTDRGARVVAIGDVGYSRGPGERWSKSAFPGGGFRLERSFRWTSFARSARWLGARSGDGGRHVELALFDPASPLWYRLTIDPRERIVVERMTADGHFMRRGYFAFDRPIRISSPK